MRLKLSKKKKFGIAFLVFSIVFIVYFILFLPGQHYGGPSSGTIIQGLLRNIKVVADLYYRGHKTYALGKVSSCKENGSVFLENRISEIIDHMESIRRYKVTCYATPETWAVSVKDRSDTWCMDSTDFLGLGTAEAYGLCDRGVSHDR